jgi:hypothetical protein
MTPTRLLPLLLLFLLLGACADGDAPVPSGDYLGQAPPAPGEPAKIFAPGIISTGLQTRDLAMSPDGDEIYYCVILGSFEYSTIMVTRRDAAGRWSEPEVAPFAANPDWHDLEPHISPDGARFFFMSDRPESGEGETGDSNLWVMERNGADWSAPRMMDAPVNTEADEYFPSSTRDGTLYFTREDAETRTGAIFRARLLEDGKYGQPERLGDAVNSTPNVFNATVDPDGRWLIVPTFGREDSFGRTDYYVCFSNGADGWEGPYNLGDAVNSAGGLEYSAALSPDGRHLFFMATRVPEGVDPLFGEAGMTAAGIREAFTSPWNGQTNIYWIDAGVIEAARPAP